MFRYEVAYFDADGTYRWKGFGYKDKFEKFLKSLVRKAWKIIDITTGDGDEVTNSYIEAYVK